MKLTLIGIGTGNPDHLTLQAIRAINAQDLILIPHKGEGKADLADLRRAICDEVLTTTDTRIAELRRSGRRQLRRNRVLRMSRCWSGGIRRFMTARCALRRGWTRCRSWR